MKRIALVLIVILFTFSSIAQNEFLNESNSFEPIGNTTTITPNTSTVSPSVFKLHTLPKPSTSTSILEQNTLQFANTNDFKNPGDVYKKKLNQKTEEDNSKAFRKNEYLGDFRSNSKYVKISYRDFGEVDGDLIRVLVNDKEVVSRVFLEGSFKGFQLDLVQGFNKIDFEALNQGYAGPNTAEFRVYDDKGMLVSANKWSLATGFKATIIVVKE